jgi:hypothetical protein
MPEHPRISVPGTAPDSLDTFIISVRSKPTQLDATNFFARGPPGAAGATPAAAAALAGRLRLGCGVPGRAGGRAAALPGTADHAMMTVTSDFARHRVEKATRKPFCKNLLSTVTSGSSSSWQISLSPAAPRPAAAAPAGGLTVTGPGE